MSTVHTERYVTQTLPLRYAELQLLKTFNSVSFTVYASGLFVQLGLLMKLFIKGKVLGKAELPVGFEPSDP